MLQILQPDTSLTGPVMGNKSSPELTLSLLLMAAVCSVAFIIEKSYFRTPQDMSWTEARLYCQKNHIDLLTLENMNKSFVAEWLMEFTRQAWIGLHRDPESDLVWKWIDKKTGEGVTGYSVSQNYFADGHQFHHCALVSGKDLMWYSVKCSSKHGFYCSEGNTIQYHAVAKSWYNASDYCWEINSDLATITQTTMDTKKHKESGWIGLQRVGGETWRWIGPTSEYRNWAPGEPLTADCAAFDTVTQKFHSNACSTKLLSVCSDDNLILVKENKTWEEAMMHCQSMTSACFHPSGPCMYTHNLLSLDDSSNFNYVRDRIYRATTREVWTGLRFLGGQWWLLNGIKLENHEMLPACPSNGKHCGTLSKYDTSKWINRDCSEKRNFVCSKQKILTAFAELDELDAP